MIREIDSRMALHPPNMSDLGTMDTGYMPIHQIEVLPVLYLFARLLISIGIELYR